MTLIAHSEDVRKHLEDHPWYQDLCEIWSIKDDKLSKQRYDKLQFKLYNYPNCCGLTTLAYFFASDTLSYVDIENVMDTIITTNRGGSHSLRPFIQFVAIKRANFKEPDYDDEDYDNDECLEEVPDGTYQDEFEYNNFVQFLIQKYNAECISEFVNPNSSNMCFIYQFKRPY